MTAPYQTRTPQDDPPPRGATAYAPPDGRPALPQPAPATDYRRRHRGLRVAGGIFVALLVVAGVASQVPEMVRATEVQTEPLPEGTVEVNVQGDSGEIVIREVGPGESGTLTAEKNWSFSRPTMRTDVVDDVVSASLDCPAGWLANCYADWELAVPEGTKVVVRSSVGDVDAREITGELVVNGSVGDVHVTGSPTRLDITTSVGEVTATLDEPADVVRARTSVGDITLMLPDDVAYDVRAESSIDPAQVLVDQSSDSPYAVDVTTSVGSIMVDDG